MQIARKRILDLLYCNSLFEYYWSKTDIAPSMMAVALISNFGCNTTEIKQNRHSIFFIRNV